MLITCDWQQSDHGRSAFPHGPLDVPVCSAAIQKFSNVKLAGQVADSLKSFASAEALQAIA